MAGPELRRTPRVHGALPIVTEHGKGITRDLSGSGVFFETDGSFSPGQSIEFSIFFEHLYPDRPVCINCKGSIIRVEKKGDRVGVATRIDSYCILDYLPQKKIELPIATEGAPDEQTKEHFELNEEVFFLKQKIQELEHSESERKQLEEALLQEKAFSDRLLDAQQDTVCLFELATGKPLRWNKRFVEVSGYTDEEISGMKVPDDFYSGDDLNRAKYAMFILLFDNNRIVEISLLTKKGAYIPFEYSATSIKTLDGKPLILTIGRDITERKRTEDALMKSEKRYRELSIVDDLTKLYNSRHFYVQLKSELDRSTRYEQPLTLLLLDLDDFKAFNDAYGHVEGNQVLIRLGQVVKRCLRQTDSAYRYGGEEFTILLPITTKEDGAFTAERIRTEFKRETFTPIPGQEVHVTVSIGIAQYQPHEDMRALVHRVDQLMYQGKKNGKDRVCSES